MPSRIFIFSDVLFGGFELVLTWPDSMSLSLQQAVFRSLEQLKSVLMVHNLDMLETDLETRRATFHIHSHTVSDLNRPDDTSIVYVCSCVP